LTGGDDRLVAVEKRESQPGEIPPVSQAALAAGGLAIFRSLPAQNALSPAAGDDRYPLLRIGGKVVEYLVQVRKCASICSAL